MQNFFFMDGYAAFIWPAYGITALVLVALLVVSLVQMKKSEGLLDDLKGAKKGGSMKGEETSS